MNNKFTVEEINLISVFDVKSRTKIIQDISGAMKHLGDGEMVELSSRVIGKLKNMSDKEFAELEFMAAD